MASIIEKLKSISKIQIIAAVLIVIGVAIMVPRARGMLDFYSEVQYAKVHNFKDGNLSPELLRPWMSIRYIAVAYAVPQKYLYDAAHIQPKKETSMIGLNRLNSHMKLGMVDSQPALMKIIRDAIVAYRANPVVTGLIEQKVEDWMNAAYVANSTGIPVETILQSVGIPVEGNAYKLFGFLSDEMKYPGGPKALLATVQKIVDAQGVKPITP